MRFVLKRRKRTVEKFRISVDFANDLDEADSLATAVAVAKADGVDVSSTFLESPTVEGTKVYVTVKDGNPGAVIVDIRATTAAGFVLQHEVLVPVEDVP